MDSKYLFRFPLSQGARGFPLLHEQVQGQVRLFPHAAPSV